jgi:ubiquinone/menaquinone biosynthesis C-methylase UbiE
MKNLRFKSNLDVWESRYRTNRGVAKWPFDNIVSMVMRKFSGAADRSKIRLLDYGCGAGNNLWFIAKEGFSGYACDISTEALMLAQRHLDAEGFPLPGDRYSLLHENSLPYSDNFFDAIIDRESLCQSDHFEIPGVINEFKRILKPGGSYLGVNFSCHHPSIKLSESIGAGDYHNFSGGLFEGEGQRHLFSVNEILDLFAPRAGWRIESLAEVSVKTLIGDGASDSSEYIISAQKI